MARRTTSVGWFVAAALIAAACSGGDTPSTTGTDGDAGAASSDPVPDEDGDAATTTAPAPTGAPAASPQAVGPCSDWPGLAAHAIETGLVDPSAAADLPQPTESNDAGYVTFEPLGESGAAAIVDDLAAEDTICDGSPSPEALAAIDAYEAAGGGVANRAILLDALAAIGAADARPAGFSGRALTDRGPRPAASEPVTPRQAFRDALAMAAAAANNGDAEGSQQLVELGLALWEADARRRIEEGTTAQDLLGIGASAQLIGDDDLSDEAIAALHEQVKAEVADAAADFDPCAVLGTSRNSALVEALARAETLGVPDVSSADATPDRRAYDHESYKRMLTDWMARNEAVANGEADDVCPGYLFRLEGPWAHGLSSGTVDVWLTTCDLRSWTGTLTSSGEMVLPDGSMAFERAYELEFAFGPREFYGGTQAEMDLDGRIQWRLEGDGFAGSWSTQASTGRATFRWVDGMAEFHAEFDQASLAGTIVARGVSVPMTFPTEFPPITQLSVLEPGGDMCKETT